MPYAINVVFLDFGGFYSAGFPPMTGMIIPLSPPFPPDTAVSNPATPTTLPFPAPTSPPSGTCAVLVRDTGPPGDLFRSGLVSALPPSPGSLTVFTAPTIPLPFASIAAATTGVAPFVSGIPTAATVLASILSAGTFIPLGVTLTGAIAPTSLAITVTGTLTARVFYFATSTFTFTLTFTAVPAPSGDAVDRSRILSVTATASTLTASGVPGFISAALAPAIAGLAASRMEAAINSSIASMVTATLGSMGLRLSTTAVICARRAAVLSSGVSLQLTLSDLLGPAVLPVLPVPKNFAVTIMPPAQAGTQQAYTVTVTDIATGAPVPQANVTLHNFAVNGSPLTVGPLTTNGSGQVTFNVALHPKIVIKIISGNPDGPLRERERVFVSPTLTVALAGFNTLTVILLTDDGGLS